MQRENCSNNSQFSEALPIYKARSAVMGLCFVLGVPGNVAVLVMLIRRLKEKNFTLSLMLNLAISDLLTLLPLPMWIWTLLHDWIFGFVACKIISYVEYWCLYSSMLCVTLLSLQRYMQVLHPQKWAKLGDKGQKGLLGGIWILSGVLTSYAPVQRQSGCDQYGFKFCYQWFSSDTEQVATSLYEILLFSMSFILLVYFYYRLHRGVNKSPFFRSNRMMKLVTRIIVTYFVFGVPVTIAKAIIAVSVLLKNDALSVTADLVGKISTALIFLNSAVNPFLYTFALRRIQRRGTVMDLIQTVQNSV